MHTETDDSNKTDNGSGSMVWIKILILKGNSMQEHVLTFHRCSPWYAKLLTEQGGVIPPQKYPIIVTKVP